MTFKKAFIDKSGAIIYVTIFFDKLYNLVGLGRLTLAMVPQELYYTLSITAQI